MSDSLRPPWTVTLQAPLSTGFSRQEYWGGLPCPPLQDLPDPEIEAVSHKSLALAGRFFTTEPPGEPHHTYTYHIHTIALPFLFPLSYLLSCLEAANTKIYASLEDQ